MSSATTSTNHSFMSKHKKKLIIAGISATAVAAIYYAYTNGYFSGELLSKSKEFLYSFGEKILEITKYSVNFFKENLITTLLITFTAALVIFFTYQAYKKRSQENEQEQKINSTNDLNNETENNNEISHNNDTTDNNKVESNPSTEVNLNNAQQQQQQQQQQPN